MALVYPDYAPSKTLAAPASYGFYAEGISSVAAVLQDAGHDVSLIHLIGRPERDEFEARVREAAPDVVGFSSRTTIWPEVRRLAGIVREVSDAPVVAGGVHVTLDPEEVAASPEVDVAVIGEGEYPLLEMCEALEAGRDYRDVDNLWVRENGGVRRNATRPLLADLDELPLPAYDIYDREILYDVAIDTGPVMLSRGCPYMCTYCCNHQLKQAYPNRKHYARFRSPRRSIEYIENLRATFPNIKYLNITDNILPLEREWFFEFIELYKERVKLPFVCRYRHNLVTRDVLEALVEAGCYLVHFGLESGNDEIRRTIINRQMSDAQIEEAHRLCREVGLPTLTYNMVGLPHENKAKFLDTVKINARVRPNRIVLSVFYPYPHTVLHDLCEREELLAPEFDYESESYLVQEGFPVSHVRFCQAYFVPAIRYYQILSRLGAVGRLLARVSDAFYKSPLLPHRLLVALARAGRAVFDGTKLFIRRRLPGLYVKLRDWRVRRA
ncbi:MAG: radical SAM protein [Candidatus Zixiibacteriota bacterium]